MNGRLLEGSSSDNSHHFVFFAVIMSETVRHITIPQYEGLALKHITARLDNGFQHVYDFLPDQQELLKVPKEWICNVVYTVIGTPFHTWVKGVVQERNKAVAKKKGDTISMDPAVAEAYYASTKVSRKCPLPPILT